VLPTRVAHVEKRTGSVLARNRSSKVDETNLEISCASGSRKRECNSIRGDIARRDGAYEPHDVGVARRNGARDGARNGLDVDGTVRERPVGRDRTQFESVQLLLRLKVALPRAVPGAMIGQPENCA